MKKNMMMRIASVLLIAVLMSTSAISGTYAKYVTKGEGGDSARVAKWGVGVVVTGDTFKETYAKDDNSFTLAENTVVSTEDVVAPGTKGDMGGVALAGIPEVACRVTYDVTKLEMKNWVDADGNVYLPINITIHQGTTDVVINGGTYTDVDAFVADVITYIESYSKDYEAGTNLAEVTSDNLGISWEWPFYVNNDLDVKDTYLGDQAANGNAATIDFELAVTVTQIN